MCVCGNEIHFRKVRKSFFFSSERQNHFCKKKRFFRQTFTLFNLATDHQNHFCKNEKFGGGGKTFFVFLLFSK
jgi:hypothetical protein